MFLFFLFFPNRSLLLKGSHGGSKRSTQKHTQSVPWSARWPGPPSQVLFQNSSRILSKVKILILFLASEKFATVKIRVWRFLLKLNRKWTESIKPMFFIYSISIFDICINMCIRYMYRYLYSISLFDIFIRYLYSISLFPNRNLFLGFSFCNQRGGYTETHRKRDPESRPRARRSQWLF